jgi:hypothetical protein
LAFCSAAAAKVAALVESDEAATPRPALAGRSDKKQTTTAKAHNMKRQELFTDSIS